MSGPSADCGVRQAGGRKCSAERGDRRTDARCSAGPCTAIDYDEIHDEIVVPQQFGQAILTFKGSARGEEPPIRVIQGSKTLLTALDRLAVDPYNDEIYVPEGDRVLVFDRNANGNVAPKRVLGGRVPVLPRRPPWSIDHTRNLLIVGGNCAAETAVSSWRSSIARPRATRCPAPGEFPEAVRSKIASCAA